MFQGATDKHLMPGYTGHIPERDEQDYVPGRGQARKQIPGIYQLPSHLHRLRRLRPWRQIGERLRSHLWQDQLLIERWTVP